MCQQFKENMRIVIDTARIITADLTKRKDCDCKVLNKGGPKCLPC